LSHPGPYLRCILLYSSVYIVCDRVFNAYTPSTVNLLILFPTIFQTNFLTIYLLELCSCFLCCPCGVGHNGDSICKITSLVFSILVDNTLSEKRNAIHEITSKRQRSYMKCLWPEVKSTNQLQARGHLTLILGSLSIKGTFSGSPE
jgi:hypothetical protein